MKKIKIFIGSSIDDLAYERRDIVSFIAELNNKYIDRGIYIEPYICEEKSNEMRPEGSQKVHDDYIENNADAMIFMFFKKAGKYTLRELQIAKDTLANKDKNSHIFIYFKTINNEVADTSEIKSAIDKIAGEYAHYYKKFSEADTIKLELLQYLSDTLGEDSLTIHNGRVYLGDTEVNDIDVSNVFAYQNNIELIALKKSLAELEQQMESCVESKNWTLLANLSEQHQKKQAQYSNLEMEILKMLQQLSKCLREEKSNPIRLKALMLLEEGRHKEALLLLPLSEIKSKSASVIEKKALQDAAIKQEANEILQDGIARLHALGFDINNKSINTEIEKTYDSILDMALIVGKSDVLIDFVMFLVENGNNEKALRIAKLIEDNLDSFEDIDLYTRYDTFNLLSDISEDDDESSRYFEQAKASLVDYIKALDKSDWKNYVDSCQRVCDLGLVTQELTTNLEDAVKIAESHPEYVSRADALHDFYYALGLIYSKVSDTKTAEEYFLKDVTVAQAEIKGIDNIADEFMKKLKGQNNGFSVSLQVRAWQSGVVEAYSKLHEIDADKYREAYVESLLLSALIMFINGNYRACKTDFLMAAHVSGGNEEYKRLCEFAEKLK